MATSTDGLGNPWLFGGLGPLLTTTKAFMDRSQPLVVIIILELLAPEFANEFPWWQLGNLDRMFSWHKPSPVFQPVIPSCPVPLESHGQGWPGRARTQRDREHPLPSPSAPSAGVRLSGATVRAFAPGPVMHSRGYKWVGILSGDTSLTKAESNRTVIHPLGETISQHGPTCLPLFSCF